MIWLLWLLILSCGALSALCKWGLWMISSLYLAAVLVVIKKCLFVIDANSVYIVILPCKPIGFYKILCKLWLQNFDIASTLTLFNFEEERLNKEKFIIFINLLYVCITWERVNLFIVYAQLNVNYIGFSLILYSLIRVFNMTPPYK